jgi:hypothetical protein
MAVAEAGLRNRSSAQISRDGVVHGVRRAQHDGLDSMIAKRLGGTGSHATTQYDIAVAEQFKDAAMVMRAVLMFPVMVAESLRVGSVVVRAQLASLHLIAGYVENDEPPALAEML